MEGKSTTCPKLALTSKSFHKNHFIVLDLAGDSTITKFLPHLTAGSLVFLVVETLVVVLAVFFAVVVLVVVAIQKKLFLNKVDYNYLDK